MSYKKKQHPHQLTIYFDPDSYKGKQLRGYAHGQDLAVEEVNIIENPPTATEFAMLLDRLDEPWDELLDTNHTDYQMAVGEKDASSFSKEEFVQLLHNHPVLLKHPIAVRGDNIRLVRLASDIFQM